MVIVDYGMGNLGSIQNMFKYLGIASTIQSRPEEIAKASRLLLPGVGAFDTAMKKINDMGLKEVLDEKALKEKVPVLGICLGMQLLTKHSEEGALDGLGWIDAEVLGFKGRIEKKYKVPHMGWNIVRQANKSTLTGDFDKFEEAKFYFVHSYFVKVDDEKNSILKTNYGLEFDSAIQRDNIYGVQFHPEKSHRFGMKLFENFARL